MEKQLSIVIPSYNMETYLPRCLDSLIIEDENLMDMLDIIVVNDGSKDRTSEIAHSYANRYPNSIRVIDKANGHYGSCINAALPVAKGRYFRILDADDWFDNSALIKLLFNLSKYDVDVVCTNFTIHESEQRKDVKINDVPVNNIISLDLFVLPSRLYNMHSLTYATSLLREIKYKQTEKISYTDLEYAFYPLIAASTIIYFDISLYQYYVGREDQSMSQANVIKCRSHFVTIFERILTVTPNKDFNKSFHVLRKKYIFHLLDSFILPIYILKQKSTTGEAKRIRSDLKLLKRIDNDTFNLSTSYKIKGIRVYLIWYYFPIIGKIFSKVIH